jgi:hypothetical protein
MRKYIIPLKVSSLVVKIAAWIVLLLGVMGAISIFTGTVPGNPRWVGAIILFAYLFFFGILFFIAKIADILVKVINATQKE